MLTLVTRPEPAAARTLARLAALGHDVLFDPMLEIRPRATRLPEGPFQALTFTSINGVQGFMAQQNISTMWPRLRTLPVYTVGPRTAEEARQTGFDHVIDCDGDARDLTARMKAELPAGTRISIRRESIARRIFPQRSPPPAWWWILPLSMPPRGWMPFRRRPVRRWPKDVWPASCIFPAARFWPFWPAWRRRGWRMPSAALGICALPRRWPDRWWSGALRWNSPTPE